MKFPRREFLHLAAGAVVLPAAARVAAALDYPTRPVHLLVGYAAGGPLDTSARLIGQWLSEHLGQPFVVENRPGAGANIATEAAEIEAVIASLGRERAGLVIMTDSFMAVHQRTVISSTASNNVPVIGADLPSFVTEGGLLSYGANFPDIFGRAASYVDRILRGANPGDLPVQTPTKYELAVNLKTAKALGLVVQRELLYRADEVME